MEEEKEYKSRKTATTHIAVSQSVRNKVNDFSKSKKSQGYSCTQNEVSKNLGIFFFSLIF